MASFRKEINCGSDGSFQGALGFKGVIRSIFFMSMVEHPDGNGKVGSQLRNTNIDEARLENQILVENYASGAVEINNWFDETYGVAENTRLKVRFSPLDQTKDLPELRAVFIYEDSDYASTFTKDEDVKAQVKSIKSRQR